MFSLKKRVANTSPIEKYVDLILGLAARTGADKLVFGVPGDDLPRTAVEPGIVRDFFRDVAPEGGDTMLVPVWARINGNWHEWAGPPWHLLHEIVRVAGNIHSESITVAMEANYCYSFTLRKAD